MVGVGSDRDVGSIDTTPTGEDEENQPGMPRKMFLPTLQHTAAPDAAAASVQRPQADTNLYPPTLQGD